MDKLLGIMVLALVFGMMPLGQMLVRWFRRRDLGLTPQQEDAERMPRILSIPLACLGAVGWIGIALSTGKWLHTSCFLTCFLVFCVTIGLLIQWVRVRYFGLTLEQEQAEHRATRNLRFSIVGLMALACIIVALYEENWWMVLSLACSSLGMFGWLMWFRYTDRRSHTTIPVRGSVDTTNG